jgi:hypothetical protein
VESHHFYAAPAPGKFFDAAKAQDPTLPYTKLTFLKQTKVNIKVVEFFSFIIFII